ncbi:MAG: DUF790 family protein [Sorangiineae bacterium]|nr:DUF790 family protein [Polyangiaceae bacterium]MEB2324557.1 DUF790 family protein [Sorangiineae bacterium]
MLSPEHVRARRRGGALELMRLSPADRERASELARDLLAVASAGVGAAREQVSAAWAAVEVAPRERKLALGLQKLIEDACVFTDPGELDPAALRRELFVAASRARAAGSFDWGVLVAEAALARGTDAAGVERALYADLRGAERLERAPALEPEAVVREWERGQVQAVLLRAVRVVAEVRCDSPAGYRALFHKLKFRRLLYALERHGEGYRLTIDGPFSLFESVTKYGLALAQVLPALEDCDALELTAEVRWGKERVPLRFTHSHRGAGALEPGELPEDVRALADAFAGLDTPWRPEPASAILDLPGAGLSVPDLVFSHRETGEEIFLEVMGYWSRDAVWRRVELVEAGLGARVLFAVSSHLRVSEAVLDDDAPGALYVYKRTMSARAVARKLDALSAR